MGKNKWVGIMVIIFAVIAGIGLYFGWRVVQYLMLGLIILGSIWSISKKS